MRLLLIALLLFGGKVLYSQSMERHVIASAGSSGATASYTIGEVVVSEVSSVGTAVFIAGFQQPIIAEDGTEPSLSLVDLSKQLSVYPNPARDYVTISGYSTDFSNARMSVFSLDGKRMPVTFENNGSEIRFNVQGLARNTYWLYLEFPDGRSVASFKLIKN